METYIVLLRGVNVGGNNLLPMKELVSLLKDNGYENAKSYLQSGNIVLKTENRLSPQDIAKAFSELVNQSFGFQPEIFVEPLNHFQQIASACPYTTDEGKLLHFYFCNETPKLDIDVINKLKSPTEQYEVIDKTLYLYAPDGIGRSKMVVKINACLGVSTTGRNLNTVKKLIALASSL